MRGISAHPAKARAEDIVAKIVEIARDKRIPSDSITVEERQFGSAIVAREQVVMVGVDADARLEGVERQILAAVCAKSMPRPSSP